MSLVAYALRTTLRSALVGKTFAMDNVFDSVASPIEEMVRGDSPRPVIIISTDEDITKLDSHDYTNGEREMDVVIELALASEITDKGNIELPHTDEGLEQALNFMTRQVMRVMQVDDGVWSDLWRSFSCSPLKLVSRRGAEAKDGVRFAARQIILTVMPLHEPRHGEPAEGAWIALLAAMRADPGLERFATGLEEEIEGVTLPDWQRTQARLGLHRGALAGVGLGPLLPGEAPALFALGQSDGLNLEGAAHGLTAVNIISTCTLQTPVLSLVGD